MGRGGRVFRGQRGEQQDRDRSIRERKGSGAGKRGKRADRCDAKDKDISRKFQRTVFENIEDVKKQENAIAELKMRCVICPICGKEIKDIESAIADKQSGAPAHFDCVAKCVEKAEKLNENEKIVYIGQGKFAVVRYEGDDEKSIHIERKIEWEAEGASIPWRHEISNLFSQVL